MFTSRKPIRNSVLDGRQPEKQQDGAGAEGSRNGPTLRRASIDRPHPLMVATRGSDESTR